MASDKVFCIFRRFDTLSVRTLLYLQDELAELEERLNAIDEADVRYGRNPGLVSLHSRRHDTNDERKNIMRIIDEKVYAYRGLL
jgi:hypothetical protein